MKKRNFGFRGHFNTGLCYLLVLLSCLIINNISAACIDISDFPLQTKLSSAPASIIFILDNSGSMDWEFMTNEPNGLYNDEGYLYPDSAFINGQDRAYGDTYILDTEKTEWKSQWHGYNKLFYNPGMDYSPWPGLSNADTEAPFSNPYNNEDSDSKLNMGEEYFSIFRNKTSVIVDNEDRGFALKTASSWQIDSDNGYPHYGDNYYRTNANNDAVDDWVSWTPDLPSPGEYTVSVWWPSNGNPSRDTSVYYEIHHNGTIDMAGPFNPLLNEGQWNDIGNFSFSGNGGECVKLIPDLAGESTYSADAVKFTKASEAVISIKNAHYFTINDIDGDGEKNDGDDIYLVNFANGIREFYLFNDLDSDDKVEDGELVFKNFEDLPDKAKPGVYGEDEEFSFRNDVDDLQNFANWFSYYRKRELTAKAAVAGSIARLSEVNVGIYAINSGPRQSVLPIYLETEAEDGGVFSVIVDNQDSGYSETGDNWAESGASNEFKGSSRYTTTQGDFATWTPDLPYDGSYKVYVWYTDKGNRDANAKYTVHHSGGEYTAYLDQNTDKGRWVELGGFNFARGSSGWVSVHRDITSNGKTTSADAVKFQTQVSSGKVVMDSSEDLFSLLYTMDSRGDTPLRTALDNVGRYFDHDDGDSGNLGESPFETTENGGACQQAFTVIMTDGFWNGENPLVGNQDGDTDNIFDGFPYEDTHGDTLADVAMKFYKNDLADALDDGVPTTQCDSASHQHMVTYGLSFGESGTLDPGAYHHCLLDGDTPGWTNPLDGDREKIDDLYHAAVNGRGLFFTALNPEGLILSLKNVNANIVSRISSGSSVSVSGNELGAGTVLYQASFASGSWTGDITAYPINPVSGEILREEDDILWKAAEELQLISAGERNIVIYNPDTETGVDFFYENLTPEQKHLLNSNPDYVDFIRGEEIPGFRSRIKKLGDIVHSAPVLIGKTVYVGSNDGMLHGFNADTGQERFAYIPNLVMDNFHIHASAGQSFFEPGYSHRFFVDLPPVADKNIEVSNNEAVTKRTYLIGGLGKGGKGYYCLDITNADSKTHTSDIEDIENMVKWEFPSGIDDDMGYSYSMPVIVKTNITTGDGSNDKRAAIFGNGYGSPNGSAVLYILGVDGSLIKKIDTKAGGCNGLSTPSVIDVDNDLRADYAYAGDLKGNLWKFDLRDSNPANWDVAYKEIGSPVPFFSVPGKSITSQPDVMSHCEYGKTNPDLTSCGTPETPGYLVMFGTGKYLSDDDRDNTDSQYIFGLWDFGDDVHEYLGTFDKEGIVQLSNMNPAITLLEQTEVDSGYYNGLFLRTLSDNTPVYTVKCDSGNGQKPDPDPEAGAHAGWFFELVDSGERIITDVIIRNNVLIFISFTPDISPCSGGGNSIVYEVDACSGSRLSKARFDITGDRQIDENDLITLTNDRDLLVRDEDENQIHAAPTGIGSPGLLQVPVFITPKGPGHLELKLFSNSSAGTMTINGIGEPGGLFYWRSHNP